MLKRSESSLSLVLQPSQRGRRITVILHLIACAAAIANSLALPVKLVLCTVIGFHLIFVNKQLAGQYRRIRYSEQSGWEVAANGGFEPIEILKSSFITTFVIILHIRSQNKDKLAILVLNDTLCEDDFRQLIVKLKTTGIN